MEIYFTVQWWKLSNVNIDKITPILSREPKKWESIYVFSIVNILPTHVFYKYNKAADNIRIHV